MTVDSAELVSAVHAAVSAGLRIDPGPQQREGLAVMIITVLAGSGADPAAVAAMLTSTTMTADVAARLGTPSRSASTIAGLLAVAHR